MQLQKIQPKPSEVELKMEINFDEYQKFLNKAAQKISENTDIQGFRRGKAPFLVVEQKVGLMKIYEEALDEIVSHFFWQAVTQEKLNTIGQPKIEIEKLAPGNPIVFKATAALMPQVKLGDYQSIKVERKKIEVNQQDIEKTIEDLRKMQVKEILVKREVKTGDRTEVDFTVSLDRVVVDGGAGKKYPVVIGEKMMIPGFEDQLIGMKAGEEKEFSLDFPKEYQNAMLAGKKGDFKVKVLSVYERQLPEATADWAKTLGAKDLNDLKEKIRRNLEDEQRFNEEQRLEIELLNKIVAKSDFSEIPEFLISNEAHRMVHEFADSISHQGIPFEDYLKSLNKDEKTLAEEFKPKALERVKTSLIIREIAELEKVEATEDELNKEIERITSQLDSEEAKRNVKTDGYKQYVRNILRNQKVIEKLKKECIE